MQAAWRGDGLRQNQRLSPQSDISTARRRQERHGNRHKSGKARAVRADNSSEARPLFELERRGQKKGYGAREESDSRKLGGSPKSDQRGEVQGVRKQEWVAFTLQAHRSTCLERNRPKRPAHGHRNRKRDRDQPAKHHTCPHDFKRYARQVSETKNRPRGLFAFHGGDGCPSECQPSRQRWKSINTLPSSNEGC